MKEKKKKLLLLLFIPPPYGGGEIQGEFLKKYFEKKNNFIIYSVSRKKKNKKNQGKINLVNILFGLKWVIVSCIKILKIYPSKVYLVLPQDFYPLIRNSLIIYLCKILKIRIFAELPGTSFLFLDKKYFLSRKIGLKILRNINDIRFLSESIKKNFLQYNFRKLTVIENGVEIPENVRIKESVFEKEQLDLLYVGSLEFSKGVYKIFEFLVLAKNKGLNIRMNLVGEWKNKNEKIMIDECVEKNGLENYYIDYGIKLNEEKWEIFKSCAILLHPTYWDGVPYSILEAMGLGLVIISTNVGGIPDVVENGKNGTLLEHNTAEDIFKAVNYYFKNREAMKEISKRNIKKFQERYSKDIFLKNMENWLNS